MWIINGDYISKIYAGTGAIQGKSVTQDISRSLSRAIQNNFLDSNKQDAMETFLFSMSRNYGELAERVRVLMSPTFLRLPYSILREVVINKSQYIEQVKCKVAIGTWNINGGFNQTDMEQVNLNEWLIDGPFNKMGNHSSFGYLDPNTPQSNFGDIDIFAIGFEEIVDLNAQNIVSASDENANKWFLKISECLKNQGDYVQLVCENLQLVGVCLFVFVLRRHVPFIRDICISKTKTGFGGTAGNKGGVLLRFIYYNTSMCFVCSHFAAHQKQIKERNDDFRQIYEQSEFVGQAVTSTSKIEVKNHDYIFWFGDLNYRIDMPNDRCRSLIGERDWKTLLELDQLSVQRAEGNVFREFIEAPIAFPPTYKYNVFEDTYDRSEKCRVPAWTGITFFYFKLFYISYIIDQIFF
jgi:phosphatidylinositol-bisphosphatase